MKGPMTISERNLSVAWGKAFLAVYDAVEVSPLVVVIDDFPSGEPIEVASIREALDEELEAQGQGSCHTVANTIFPKSMSNPEASRGELFDRYLRIYPHLRKMHKANRNGMYFQRLIAFGSDNNGDRWIQSVRPRIDNLGRWESPPNSFASFPAGPS